MKPEEQVRAKFIEAWGIENRKPLSPFDEGVQAAKSEEPSWFSCPYRASDIFSTYKRRQWMNGFNSVSRFKNRGWV